MIIHTFGAFFGLSVAMFYQPKEAIEDKFGIGVGNYLSDLVSMIGTGLLSTEQQATDLACIEQLSTHIYQFQVA